MKLPDIEAGLKNADFQYRIKAIAALKNYAADLAVPILLAQLQDPEFLVRSFVAMGLGKQQTAESFAALLQMIKFDNTPSVRAEAANSLSLFGRVAASHLVQAAFQDDHWLVRRSIMAALADLDCHAELYEVSLQALNGEDETVQQAAIDALGTLANTPQRPEALQAILTHAQDEAWRTRMQVAYALKQFDHPEARTTLAHLRQDPEHRVAGAALENLLP